MVPVSVLRKFFYASVNFKLSRHQLRGLFLVAHLLSYFFGYFFAMPWQYVNCISAFFKTRPIPYHPRCVECALRLITTSRLNNSSHHYLSHVLRKGGLMHLQNIYIYIQASLRRRMRGNLILFVIQYQPRPACACRSRGSDPKLLAVNKFSACRSTCSSLPHDPVEYPTEWILWIHNHLIPCIASCITDML